jgi:hypothetical protein
MKTFLLGLAVVAATLLGGTTAQAGFLNGLALFSAKEVPPANFSGTLQSRTYVSQDKSLGTGSFSAVADAAGIWAGFSVDSSSGGNVTSISNSTFGSFTRTAVNSDVTTSSNRTIMLTGTFTGGSLLTGYDPTPVTLKIKIDKLVTGLDAPNDYQFITNVTLQAVPEPTSIALFGLGALGLVARRFRRK